MISTTNLKEREQPLNLLELLADTQLPDLSTIFTEYLLYHVLPGQVIFDESDVSNDTSISTALR
jgi:hypothetical protein